MSFLQFFPPSGLKGKMKRREHLFEYLLPMDSKSHSEEPFNNGIFFLLLLWYSFFPVSFFPSTNFLILIDTNITLSQQMNKHSFKKQWGECQAGSCALRNHTETGLPPQKNVLSKLPLCGICPITSTKSTLPLAKQITCSLIASYQWSCVC